jgi:hypothetical protein
MKKMVTLLLAFALMLCGVSAFAEAPAGVEILSPEDILSIQAPTASWQVLTNSDAWFAIGDGNNIITIDHLSNGEALPASFAANDRYGAVYQANISTPNEVFCVMGCAASEEDLDMLMRAVGSIKILKKNTKTAATDNDPLAGTGYSLRPINQVYYCTSDPLLLRTSWTYESDKAGTLPYGQGVMVDGAVTRNGADIGWYQVQYNNGTVYGPSQYFSPTPLGGGQPVNPGTGNAGAGVPAGGVPVTDPQIQQQSEAVASQPFTVYPMAGGEVKIWRLTNGQYTDSEGRTYTQTPKGLYVCDQTNVTYSADPNYWNTQQSEETASQAFTVYPMAGGEVRIQRQADGKYADSNGNTYTQTPKGLYVCDQTNVTYSADPNYWTTQQSEETASQAFTIYPKAGGEVRIQRQADGTYADSNGNTYTQTPKGLYVSEQTGATYSADPNYWSSIEQQETEEEIEQHAQDLGDDRPDDEVNEEDELEQHAQDLGDDEPSHD